MNLNPAQIDRLAIAVEEAAGAVSVAKPRFVEPGPERLLAFAFVLVLVLFCTYRRHHPKSCSSSSRRTVRNHPANRVHLRPDSSLQVSEHKGRWLLPCQLLMWRG